MLQALRTIPPAEAQKVLVVLTERLLPNPFDQYSYDIDPALLTITQKEVRNRVYVQDNDNSDKARSKMLTFISNEISTQILTYDRKQNAKERLLKKGLLPLNKYELVFNPTFKEFEQFSIRKSHVESSFAKPDSVYHVHIDDKVTIILFATIFNNDDPNHKFMLLSIGITDKNKIVITSALRIYYSDIEYSNDFNLNQMLIAFLEKYALLSRTPNEDSSMERILVDYAVINTFDIKKFKGGETFNFNILKSYNPENSRYASAAYVFKTEFKTTIKLYYAFIINADKYTQDLSKHGVLVSL
ncbi:hypothetical protein GCM10028806_28080 [Spirosoma terrae]|uniref:Uncharacterized protein n=1 Tax=Spirosoma terrae TaxID=1968276 RepID=A0A6L9LKM1_9BACT|nr:hypothetical protein [Spirosoma terrae]NDU97229.1 hypothetical protein [Spirosoma terrae]